MDRLVVTLGLGAGALVVAGLWMGLVQAPPDAVQGEVQRIMYLHVPSILTAYLAFTVVLVCSIGYLVRGTRGWDRLAHASAEVGVVFTAITLLPAPSGASRRGECGGHGMRASPGPRSSFWSTSAI